MKTQLVFAAAVLLFPATAVFAQTSGSSNSSGSASVSDNMGTNSGSGTAANGMNAGKVTRHHHASKSADGSPMPAASTAAKEVRPPGSGPTSGR